MRSNSSALSDRLRPLGGPRRRVAAVQDVAAFVVRCLSRGVSGSASFLWCFQLARLGSTICGHLSVGMIRPLAGVALFLSGADLQAAVAILGAQYQQDEPYPEFNCIWSDSSYPGSCPSRAPGCNVHVYLKNTGASAVTIDDVTIAGYNLNTILKANSSYHDSRSIYYNWDTPPQDIFDAGEPVWFKGDPATIPAGGVAQVVVRLRRIPTTGSVAVGVVTSAETVDTNILVDATAPQLASVGFSQDRMKVYLHWRRSGGAAPNSVWLDGSNVTVSTTTVGDTSVNFGVSVIQLAAPLPYMSYHVFQGVYADGKAATASLRVWSHPFLHASWGTFPTAIDTTADAQAWIDEATKHSFNAGQNQGLGGALGGYLATSAGQDYANARGGYGLIVWNTSTFDNPIMSFLDDEPDAEESNVANNFCGTGLKMPCGTSPMGILAARDIAIGEAEYRSRYPNAPTTVNMNGSFKPENYYAWGQAVDVLQVDPYYQRRLQDSYWRDQQKIPLYQKATYIYAVSKAVTRAAEPNPSHVLLYSCEWKCTSDTACDPEYLNQIWPFPTPESKRIEAYYALAAGSKGLSYWWFKPGYPSNGLGDQAKPTAQALWKEMGLYGNEIKTISDLIVLSHPVDLPIAPGTNVWARALAAGSDALILLVVNDDYYNDPAGCHYNPVNNATAAATLPLWLRSAPTAFEVTAGGLRDVGSTFNGAQMQLSLGTLQLTKMIVVTTNPQLRASIQQRYDQQVRANVCAFAPEVCVNNPPGITQHPASQNLASGGTASLSVVASGSSPLAYQWQKNSGNLANAGHYSGVTTPSLAISSADSADAASYRCVVANAYGSVTSSPATLTIITNVIAPVVVLTKIPLASGYTANEARAISSDGKYAVGFHGTFSTSGSGGFLYDIVNQTLRNSITTPDASVAAALTGVGYRIYSGQTQLVLDGWSAGWHANFMTIDSGASWSVKRQDVNLGSLPGGPAANSMSGTTNDAFYATLRYNSSNAGNPIYVGKASGVWPMAPSWDVKGIPTGITAAMNAVSATGRAVGYRNDATGARNNYAIQWNGFGTPDNWFFNGMDGTTKGEAFCISADGTIVYGRSVKPGGSTNLGYLAVLTTNVPASVITIYELPGFPDSTGSTNLVAPYGCTADGKFAVGMNFRSAERAVLWDTSNSNPTRWTVLDLTDLAAANGALGTFTRLSRAYSVGTNAAGKFVIAGIGVDGANNRAFVMTLTPPLAPWAHPPTMTISGSHAAGFTFRFTSLSNANIRYYLESATNLQAPVNWNSITSTPGIGPGTPPLYDSSPGGEQRFYRLRVQ